MPIEVTNNDIVVLAIFQCGGATESIDVEFIADSAFQLAPARFAWRHFPDRIDLRTVQYALKNALAEANARITGSLKHGYQMTPVGIEWATQHIDDHANVGAGSRVGSSTHYMEIERQRLRQSSAHRKVSEGRLDELSKRDYESFVRINEYFPATLRDERVQRIRNLVTGQNDLELTWKTLDERFKE